MNYTRGLPLTFHPALPETLATASAAALPASCCADLPETTGHLTFMGRHTRCRSTRRRRVRRTSFRFEPSPGANAGAFSTVCGPFLAMPTTTFGGGGRIIRPPGLTLRAGTFGAVRLAGGECVEPLSGPNPPPALTQGPFLPSVGRSWPCPRLLLVEGGGLFGLPASPCGPAPSVPFDSPAASASNLFPVRTLPRR